MDGVLRAARVPAVFVIRQKNSTFAPLKIMSIFSVFYLVQTVCIVIFSFF